MKKDEIKKSVEEYFKRKDVRKFKKSEVDTWELTSGIQNEWGNREFVEVVRGRFIDAVAHFVQKSSYWGWWCTDPLSDGHGKITKLKIRDLKPKNL